MKGIIPDPPAQVRPASSLVELTARVKSMKAVIFTLERNTLERAYEVGKVLQQVKQLCGHGEWTPWLEKVGLERRRANEWMRVAQLSEDDVMQCSTIREALELAPAEEAESAPAKAPQSGALEDQPPKAPESGALEAPPPAAPEREPGDDTDEIAAEEAQAPQEEAAAPPDPPESDFDKAKKKAMQGFGILIRALDDLHLQSTYRAQMELIKKGILHARL